MQSMGLCCELVWQLSSDGYSLGPHKAGVVKLKAFPSTPWGLAGPASWLKPVRPACLGFCLELRVGTQCSVLGFTPEDNNSMWLLLRPAFPRNEARAGDINPGLADEIESQACDLTLKQGHHISEPLDF